MNKWGIGGILVILLLFSLTGCGIKSGIDSLDKATSQILQVDSDISSIRKSIENHTKSPIKIKVIEKKINEIGRKIEEVESFVVDEVFSERYEKTSQRYNELLEEFRELEENEESKNNSKIST